MSVSIKRNNKIVMTRGDTLRVHIDIVDNAGNEYIPCEGDQIRFALKKNYNDLKALIIKDIPIDTCILHLESKDTKYLEQPSVYVYDIQLTMSDGTVDTFISSKLELIEEVD